MCGGGNDVTKTNATSKQTYTPAGQATMQDIISRAQGVSQLPYTPITQQIAGLTPEQQQAMTQVGNAYSMVSPYLQSAAGHFENAANPLSAQDIQQYLNPYIGAVTANMNEVFGQQQRDTTGKLTGAAGGVGADRIAVGQAELARQQGLAAGQTYAGIYQNALQAAQNQQGIEQASAFGLGNLSQAEINAILSAAGSQFGMGTVGQQTNQAANTAQFNQQMAEAAYPFQTAQWYASLGLPAAGAMGGTTKGNQTGTVNPPDPNMFSQIAGLGLTALGAFAKDGGRIKGYATGGSPYGGGGNSSYVPVNQINAPQAQAPELSYLSPSSPAGGASMGGIGGKGSNVQAGQGARNIYDRLFTSPDVTGGGWDATVSPSGTSGWGNFLSNLMPFKSGGRVEDSGPYKILHSIARGKGGEVEEAVHKDFGGSLGSFLNPLMGGKDKSGGVASALGFRPIWEAVQNPSPYSLLGMMSQNAPKEQRGEGKEGEGSQMQSQFGLHPIWELLRKSGGEVNGYAFGGGPLPFYMQPSDFELGPMFSGLYAQAPAKFQARADNSFVPPAESSPYPETVVPKNRQPGYGVTSVPKLGSKLQDRPPQETSVPSLLTPSATSPEGVNPFPADSELAAPPQDYNVYTPEGGYAKGPTKDPLGRYVPGKQYKWSDTPQDPSQVTAGPGTIPEGGGDVPFAEGVDGPVSPNATSRTLAANGPFQPGEYGSPGTGRWSAAFANVPPYERPKLFGKELSNMNIALMAAGLGIMGGESPYFGVNFGQGGLKGVAALKEFQQLDAERQARYMQQLLAAGNLDVDERRQSLAESMKPFELEQSVRQKGWMAGRTREEIEADIDRLHKAHPELYPPEDYPAEGAAAPEEAATTGEVVGPPEAGFNISYPEGADKTMAVPITSMPKDVDKMYKASSKKGLDTLVKEGAEVLETARKDKDAQEQVLSTWGLSMKAFASLPRGGMQAPGPFFQERTALSRFAQTAKVIVGGQSYDAFNAEQIKKLEATGNAEALIKYSTRMGFDLARTLGTREAMQVIQQALAAVQNGNLTPQGFLAIAYGVRAGIDRALDRDKYITNWAANSKYGNAFQSDVYFDDKVGQWDKYANRADALTKIASGKFFGNLTQEKMQRYYDYLQEKAMMENPEMQFQW